MAERPFFVHNGEPHTDPFDRAFMSICIAQITADKILAQYPTSPGLADFSVYHIDRPDEKTSQRSREDDKATRLV